MSIILDWPIVMSMSDLCITTHMHERKKILFHTLHNMFYIEKEPIELKCFYRYE